MSVPSGSVGRTDLCRLATTRVEEVLQLGIDAGHFPGAQFYASVHGEVVVDTAVGEARFGRPMTPDSLVSWQCATKPLTAAVVCVLAERGLLDLDDPVARYLPEFGGNGKGSITVRHLLSHTGGFANDPPWASYGPLTQGEIKALVCSSRLRDRWQPGADVQYSNWYGFAALGLVAAEVAGRPFNRLVSELLFDPLELRDCWIGVDKPAVNAAAERIAFVYDVAGPTPEILPFGGIFQGRDLETCSPASGGLGPMRGLGRIYESFLDSLADGPRAVLAARTVRQMRQRAQLTSGRPAVHGLGFLLIPRLFGGWCPNAFGHPGLRCVQAFADPDSGVVIAAMVNGLGRGLEHTDVIPAAANAVHDTLVEAAAV